MDNPNFAGGGFSYFQRQIIGLFGVNLTQRQSLIPDLRASNKFQSQSNAIPNRKAVSQLPSASACSNDQCIAARRFSCSCSKRSNQTSSGAPMSFGFAASVDRLILAA